MAKKTHHRVTKMLEHFERSREWVLILYVGAHTNFRHYSSMNSAQTSWAIAIKRGGFDMVARTCGDYLLIFKGKRHGKTFSI